MNDSIEMIRFCRAFLRGVSDLPIRPSEFAVLGIMCSTSGPHTPAGLAEIMRVSKPMLSAHLSALVAGGFVLRVPSPEDGRSVYVMPSKTGMRLFQKYATDSEKVKILKAGLGQKNFDKFIQLIKQANRILDN